MPSRSARPSWKGRALSLSVVLTLGALARPASAQEGAPADTLTLAAALTRAEAASPALRAAALEVEARTALVRQAGRRPNPSLDVEGENLASSGEEVAQLTGAVAQRIELGGDRAARRALAQTEAALAAADGALLRLSLGGTVRARYAEAAAAQTRAALARETVRLARLALAATTEQVDAGARSPLDQTRAEVAALEAEAEAARAEALLTAALARLSAVWGGAPVVEAVAPLSPPGPPPALDTLLARLDASPALARFAAEAARRAAAVRVEEAARVPDLTVSAGYRQFFEGGGGALVAGVSLPLPFFDRNRDAVRAAQLRRAAVEAEREAARLDARGALADASGALTAAFAEAEALRTDILPRAADVAARIEEGYEAGKFDLLDVLDAQRTLAAVRLRHADALAQYGRALADLERLLGAPLFPSPNDF